MQSARTNLTANWHKPEEHLISCRSSDLIPNLSMKDELYVLLFIITDRTTGRSHGHYRNNAVFFVRDSPVPVFTCCFTTISLDSSVFNYLSLCRFIFVPAKQPTVLSNSPPVTVLLASPHGRISPCWCRSQIVKTNVPGSTLQVTNCIIVMS